MNKKSSVRIGILLLAVCASVGAAYWLLHDRAGPPAPQAQAGQPPTVAVEATQVTTGPLARELEAVGSLQSNESVIIRPEIAGRIAGIHFDEGQRVKKGDLLVSLDDSIYKAELAQAKASLRLSQKNYERAVELLSRHAGTGVARDQTLSQLEADKATVALKEAMLDKTKIEAPFDGVRGLKQVSVGDYVNVGEDVVNLESLHPLKVDCRVPAVYLRLLEVGQTLRIRVDAFPDETFTGTVYAIDPRIDVNGRAVALRATIPNEDGRLRPGLFARVTLVVDRREDAIIVPEQAIVPRGDEKFVFKVLDGKAVMSPVRTGQRREGQIG